MKQLTAWIEGFARELGGVGLFVVCFLDSSFLSLPQINDILIILLVVQHEARVLFYASMATLGSVAGCLAMYFIGQKGGDTLLRKRFKHEYLDRTAKLFQRYGILAILVPALLPPPAPFKIFVLMAGVSEVPYVKFVLAVACGRGLRFFGIGLLALWYGEQAIALVKEHAKLVAVVIGMLVLVTGGGLVLWTRRSSARRGR